MDDDPGIAGGLDDIGMTLRRPGRDVEIADAFRGEAHGLADPLGTLDENPPRAPTHRTPGEPADLPHPLGRRVGQDGALPASGVVAQALAPAVAGTLALATSTSAANAASSLTASSASMRRSTSTSAARRPWMNRL